jgi:cyanamide hydratase
MSDFIQEFGFTAVPASASTLLTSTPAYPKPNTAPIAIPVSETPIPTTPLAQRINTYARTYLPEPTYNHSLRVYHFGQAIKKYRFASSADWDFSDETYFLACVLHDIGTTDKNLSQTRLSFEFYGGFLALDVLQRGGCGSDSASTREQAESVAEAIIRHQDLCAVGKITAVGQLLQLATIFGTCRICRIPPLTITSKPFLFFFGFGAVLNYGFDPPLLRTFT